MLLSGSERAAREDQFPRCLAAARRAPPDYPSASLHPCKTASGSPGKVIVVVFAKYVRAIRPLVPQICHENKGECRMWQLRDSHSI